MTSEDLDMGKAEVFDASGASLADVKSPWVRFRANSKVRWSLGGLLAIALVLLPSISTADYLIHIAVVGLIWIPLSVGQNIVTGNAGVAAMGQAAFYGVGAYSGAILSITLHWPAILTVLAGMALAALLGLIISLPTVRVSGDYVFIVTMGLNLIFLDFITQSSITGQASGLAGVPIFSIGPWEALGDASFYWVALVFAALVVAVALLIVHSRMGRTLTAIRDDEMASLSSGIRLGPSRVGAIVISSGMAGGAGVLLAYYLGSVGPASFNTQASLLIFEMAIIGGLGSVPGSIVGALIMVALPELLRPLQDVRLGLGGLLIVVLMIWRPNGILGHKIESPLAK